VSPGKNRCYPIFVAPRTEVAWSSKPAGPPFRNTLSWFQNLSSQLLLAIAEKRRRKEKTNVKKSRSFLFDLLKGREMSPR
jgi:hypothetical protein